MRRRRAMCTAAGLLFLCNAVLSAEDPGAFGRPVQLEVKAQPMVDALNQFARQAGIRIIFYTEVAKGVIAPPLVGSYTPDAALKELLKTSDLEYIFKNRSTVEIHGSSQSAQPKPAAGSPTVAVMRVVEAEAAPAQPSAAVQQNAQNSTPTSSNTELQEIVVTAQKRKERLQDVPMSISVLDGDMLDRSNIVNIADGLNKVPGVVASNYIQATQVQIRGVAASGPFYNGASPVAYYIDSVPFGMNHNAIMPNLEPYDLERIEVLRGPQGTLYGSGGMGGVVRVLTNDANSTEMQVKTRVSTSSTTDGGWNYGANAALNVPIIEGKLAARLAVGYQDLSGWIDGPTKEDVNPAVQRNARIKINAQPTERLSIGLSAWRVNDDFGWSTATDDGRTFVPTPEPITNEFSTYGLRIGYDFAAFSVSSMSSYIDYESFADQDLSRFGLPWRALNTVAAETFAQEILLNSTHKGPWRWTAGGMYRDNKEHRALTLGPFPAGDAGFQSESFAVFGELTRSFLGETLDVTVGARYFEDAIAAETFAPIASIGRVEESFDKVTSRGVITWRPSKDFTLYGSFSQGFRSGQPYGPGSSTLILDAPRVSPDTLTNYELGAKADFFDELLTVEAAVYFTDWQDVQQALGVPFRLPGGNTIVCCGIVLVNSEAASGPGFETSLTVRPLEGLELTGTFAWNDLTLDGDITVGDNNEFLVFEEGQRLNFSSEYTVGFSGDYAVPLGASGLTGRFAASANYSSSVLNRLGVSPVEIVEGDDFTVANASFAVEAATGWVFRLYGDNLTNESNGVPRFAPSLDMNPRSRPRTVGFQVDYRFK